MITRDNFKQVLEFLGFESNGDIYFKKFEEFDCELKVDFKNEKLIYPENKNLKINERQTCNFKQAENFVVFECVFKLLSQGYNPKHIELEPKWKLGHGASGGRADILIKDNNEKPLLIIECKTAGSEFKKSWDNTLSKPTQLFTYYVQVRSTKFLSLYTSDFIDEKVIRNYYLINIEDIPEILNKNTKLLSYANSTSVDEIYKVWRDTYSKDYTTFGIFENNKPYRIGEAKPSTETLKNITSKDIQGKYHEFATILRQHNVSGRENAFDKLINLFLCKVTDEEKNPQDLNFYWRGKAYDNPFDFQDRLQHLYKIGMGEFLGDDITYIANHKIDEAFDVFKNKPNKTKETIKDFVKQLKFFTNNDFAFIEVHNEHLFHQNFEILLKVSKMIQDIKLTESEENQFLGDMFESFLDQGVKQSEGQFFTPMPIIKFIIGSLPKIESPKVIDYACGAGHFLNEYATLFKTKEEKKNVQIVGIEKEYRLSKVSKVSSFMYGSDIDIIYEDALKKNSRVKNDSFNVLIANPPYSVKGFLQTLSDEDRNSYDLINFVDNKSYSKTGAIECFFIEKAKQILEKDAVAGIIVPSSILNKDTPKLYTKTREIILKYFDIISIAEFGSGTFGKTGTNTVTLFLRRRSDIKDIATHYDNMVNTWFECDLKSNNLFKNSDLLKKYCSHIEIDFNTYKTLLCENINDSIFEHETFKEYKYSFEKSSISNELKKKKYFKNLDKKEQYEILKKELIKYIKEIEKEKLYYFMLASSQNSDVVIIKSPTKTNEIKKFLGYEWGARKGNEGIKYLSSSNILINEEIEEDELDTDDKRVLENLEGLKYINTPLYNPSNVNDNNKINKIIKDNFEGIKTPIPESLKEFVSRANLIDMFDFNRTDFNKALSLNPNKNIEILGQKEWQKKLGDVVDILIGGTPSRNNNSFFNGENLWVSISEMNGQIITDTKEKITNDGIKNSNVKLIPKGTTLLSFKLSIGKTALAGKDLYTNEAIAGLIPKSNSILDKYLFQLFNGKLIDLEKDNFNTFGKSLNITFLENEVKIPVPPLNKQKDIIKECEVIDNEVAKASELIKSINQTITNDFNLLYQNANKSYRLSDSKLFELFIGKRVLSKDIEDEPTNDSIVVYSANVFESFGYINKDLIKDFSMDSIIWGIDGDWMVNHITKDKPFYPTDHCGVLRVKTDEIHPIYLKFALEQAGIEKRFSRSNRASTERIKALTIKVPSISEQGNFIEKIKKLKFEIDIAEKVINCANEKKKEIIKKHLN